MATLTENIESLQKQKKEQEQILARGDELSPEEKVNAEMQLQKCSHNEQKAENDLREARDILKMAQRSDTAVRRAVERLEKMRSADANAVRRSDIEALTKISKKENSWGKAENTTAENR